jgi:cyclopropane-fatty-acyl-phospholipid synthase
VAIQQQQRPGTELVPEMRERRPGRVGDRLARAAAFAVLKRLRHGEITIEDGGERHRFGEASATNPLRATVTVHDATFYRALLTGGSRALALAYIDGAWDTDDALTLTRIGCLNLGRMDDLRDLVGPVWQPIQRALRWSNRNTRSGSARHIHQHYDIGNDFYTLMFDPTMLYSCGQYARPDMTLHEAQVAKLERICQWLRLNPDDHVVEIGAGWGGFAVHAAQNYGCRVTTTTISREQYDFVVAKVAEAGLQNRVSVVMQDYRDMRGSYDKLVAMEVIESIGAQYLDRFFATCSNLLAPDGLMFIQAIVTSHRLFKQTRFGRGFASDIIFPGGCTPSVTAMLDCVGKVTDMRPLYLEDITPGYPPTLLAWRENVDRNLERVAELGYDERFQRMWRLYMSYCAGAFESRRINDVQMLLAKPGFRDERVRPD